jgi:hypothetical protein
MGTVDSRLVELAAGYRAAAPHRIDANLIAGLASYFSKRRESTVIDAVAAATAVEGLLSQDHITWDKITPQMREAFSLAYPTTSLASLEGLQPEQLSGFVNGWKGKYFEVLVRDELNSGHWMGDIHLAAGQHAALAESITQPGWDLQILNADGSVADKIQLKATESLAYIRESLERYPDFHILATNEVAGSVHDLHIHNSGIAETHLAHDITAPLADVLHTGFGEFLEDVIPLVPFLIIVGTEGRAVMAGRSSLMTALGRARSRSTRTGTAMIIGRVIGCIPGVGPFMAPVATMGTRMALDRFRTLRATENFILKRTAELVELRADGYA